MNRLIVVVPREELFREFEFQGFLPADKHDFEAVVRRHMTYVRRGLAEKDPSLKQPIAYCLIVNPEKRKVFAYRRSTRSQDYQEQRLQGKWSWGVGGHIEKHDGVDDPVRASMLRELCEEVELPDEPEVDVLGYINDDSNPVGQVHFGILYKIATSAGNVVPRGSEMAWGGFVDLARLEEILASPECEVETWSQIAMPALRNLLAP
ncbi:MAG: NUDIX domain-containing protein [candidate division KSB1 bacterium]|nr:NUDIX domain-containing protein [candidate division KSB1 bacterium]MDZ7294692.1 NUDIX domain-containing protein [candidate division KSB1 bacterium]MDZ7377830.1 NUDIX domain-containing protein [candidate division KSB1 bacterium]MDZ7384657.1 NUDIX domain-containing protein [candidate division KSB1 bacterium]MDZ7393089.1 NUDIX domain-containing protein [candidate division KSB1 bacterium]